MSPKSPVKDVQEALFSEVKNVQETLFSGGQGESPPKREMIVELSGGGGGDTRTSVCSNTNGAGGLNTNVCRVNSTEAGTRGRDRHVTRDTKCLDGHVTRDTKCRDGHVTRDTICRDQHVTPSVLCLHERAAHFSSSILEWIYS